MTTAACYELQSLEDLARMFDERGRDAMHAMNRARAARDRAVLMREWSTWELAARLVRESRIVPPAAAA